MKDVLETTTIGQIVANDFRAAAVFDAYGIDFCCGGKRRLDEACQGTPATPADIVRELEALTPTDHTETDVVSWPLDRLIDHIVSTHHGYVRSAMPTIQRYLAKLVDVHGSRHPELSRIAGKFEAVAQELAQHMMKEERVLFPYVRELTMTAVGGRHFPSPFGSVENPIRMMEREHREAADELRQIRELTNGYTVPSDGCTTYAVCIAELDRFEQDLHRHVHLENNVLFPKAIALENGY
jgi:regulator of cell morphogenesis and NO signaling